jgi:hypothetical protein
MPAVKIKVAFTLDDIRDAERFLGLLEDQTVRDKAIVSYSLGTLDRLVMNIRQALAKANAR